MPKIDDFPLKKWPEDWDLHLARAFRSYLKDNDDSEDVCFETATFIGTRISGEMVEIDKSALRMSFKLRSRRWLVYFTFDGEYITADIAYVIVLLPIEDAVAKDFYTYPEKECIMQTAIKSPVCIVIEKDILDVIRKVHEAIWEDYRKRKGFGGGGGDGDDDTEPDVNPPNEGVDRNKAKKPHLIGVWHG